MQKKFYPQNWDRKIKVSYVNIPLLFSFNTDRRRKINFNAVLGPQLGFNLGASISSASGQGSDTLTTAIAVKSTDFGLAYGAGVGIMMNTTNTLRLDLGYRGVSGLVDIVKPTSSTANVYTIRQATIRTNALYVGITFLF